MATTTVIFVFIAVRILDVIIAASAPSIVPYLGFFPYRELLDLSQIPPYLSYFGNFDGIHYVRIAAKGYDNFEQAFFPLYPLTIRYMSIFTMGNIIVAGLVTSLITGIIGIVAFAKYLETILKSRLQIRWTLIFLLAYPASFFFGAIYGESLFFCLISLALLCLQKKRTIPAMLFAALASASRLAGAFLIIPFIIHVIIELKHSKHKATTKNVLTKTALVISPLVGLVIYMLYLWQTEGDPMYFLTVQPIFGAYRSTSIILLPQVLYRYAKIIITANRDFRYFVSVLELGIFLMLIAAMIREFITIIKLPKSRKNWSRLGLALFSSAYLILPTLTGTLSSMPRYGLMVLSAFIAFAQISSKPFKYILIVVFAILHAVVLSYFIQGYFIG